MKTTAVLVLAAISWVPPVASGWLLEGLVGSWVMPEVNGGNQQQHPARQKTQPLKVAQDPQEPEDIDLLPIKPHRATSGPSERSRRTQPEPEGPPRPTSPTTTQDIEATTHLYRLLKERRSGSGRAATSKYSVWKERQNTCILRFICEVHMQDEEQISSAGDVEKNVAKMLKRFDLESPESPAYKYTFAAHMGRLLRDSPGSGCHELFNTCPFSKKDMLMIMWSLDASKYKI